MPFDMEKWKSPAAQGDLGGMAIQTTVALYAIVHALERIEDKLAIDLSEHLTVIRNAAVEFDKLFEELSGYSK